MVATAALAACEGAPAAPSSAHPVAPSFAAVRSKSNMSVPVELAVFVQCANDGAGELVQLAGLLHVVSQVTLSSSGHMSVYGRFQPQGISGKGLVTGNKYQGTGITEFSADRGALAPRLDGSAAVAQTLYCGPGTAHGRDHVEDIRRGSRPDRSRSLRWRGQRPRRERRRPAPG